MSRSGYMDGGQWDTIRWRGAVTSAIRGRRGQALLRELAAALDAMPEKRLIAEEIMGEDGSCCALGAVAKRRGIDVDGLDPEDSETVAVTFGIAKALACEIVYINDEQNPPPRVRRIREHWKTPDGRTYCWRKGVPLEMRNRAKHVPDHYVEPTAEEIAESERRRWEEMRAWVAANLRDDGKREGE